jgi:hypothetical protein
MKGHEYRFAIREACGALLPTLAVLICIAAGLKLMVITGLMPAVASVNNAGTTILAHQASAARSHYPGEVVLLGDSTCLVGVDAASLSRELPGQPPALNLSLFIWLALKDYGEVLADFASANPGQVRTVVLLLTPEKLGADIRPTEEELWHNVRREVQGLSTPIVPSATLRDRLGFGGLRENLLSHVLATPLRGKGPGVAFYGFCSGVDAYMTAHDGSYLEFGSLARPRKIPQRKWAFVADLEVESRAFRSRVPPGAKFFAGLTPIAESYCSPDERVQRLDMLHRWNRWIQADALLTNLPPSLPDVLFAGQGHLNEAGQKRFTSALARQLSQLMDSR